MINHFAKRGAEVIYGSMNPPVHVSGHGSAEELKLVLNLVRPRYFLPIHGEYRQLAKHAALAQHLRGAGLEETFVLETGETLEIDHNGARRGEKVPVGRVCIDSGSIDEVVEDIVIRDRRHLSEDGFVLPIIAINKHTGKSETLPEIVSRGFMSFEDGSELLQAARQVVAQTLESSSEEERTDWGVMQEKIRADLKRFLSKETSAPPADHAGDFGGLDGATVSRRRLGLSRRSATRVVPSGVGGRAARSDRSGIARFAFRSRSPAGARASPAEAYRKAAGPCRSKNSSALKSALAARSWAPGVSLDVLQAAAARTGQFYAPDPTETTASIGGTIATNASGSRSFRYGSTRRHILRLRVALMDGTRAATSAAATKWISMCPRSRCRTRPRTPPAIRWRPAWIGSICSPAAKARSVS